MAVSLLPWLDQFFTDSNGNPLTGGTVETYAAGTSTPKTTWSDPAGTVANANPVPLGSNGRPTSGGIYGTIGEGYKIIVKNSAGVEQPCSRDNVFFPAVTSGGSTGNFLDKVTTDPQSVAGAVTWAETQSMSNGLRITGGWYGSTSPQLFYTTDDTAYTLSQQYSNARQLVHVVREARSAGSQSEVATDMIAADDGVSSTWKARITDDGVNESLMLSQSKLTSSRPLDITGAHTDGWSMQMPGGSWLKASTPGSLYFTSHANPSPAGDGAVLHLGASGASYARLAEGDGTNIRGEFYTQGNGTVMRNYSSDGVYSAFFVAETQGPGGKGKVGAYTLGASWTQTNLLLQWTNDYGNLALNSAGWTFSSTGGFTMAPGGDVTIGPGGKVKLTPTNFSGTATALVGRDTNGYLVSYPLGSGGFVGLSGHNQATTPWSIGNGLAWVSTDAGYWFDQTGTYQNWIKGNLLIDQGVSNVATLYRQSFSVGQTICLMFDGQDSLGAQVRYAETCGQIAGNTAGAVNGEWYTKIAVAGVMTDRIRADQTGGVLTGAWNITGALTSTTAKFTSTVSISGATGTNRVLQWETSNSPRWAAYITSDAESGGNAGSKWALARYTDAGAVIDNAVVVDRATAGVTLIGALILPASTATLAPLTIPTGVAVTSPATGNVWSAAADQMQWRSGANSRSFSFLEVAQTYSAVKTFSATPVISSTTASTTAGAIYKRTGFGHVGYEAGMAQEFNSCVYTGPVGTALTNSTTETDVTGGTALFGTRTLSTSVMQNGVKIRMQTKAAFTNSAANTLTLRFKFGATVVATITITSVVASATPIDIWCDGVATAAPGASVETLWTCGVEGATAVVAATAAGTIQNLATSTATALSMTAQWSSALATSTYHTKATEIILQ